MYYHKREINLRLLKIASKVSKHLRKVLNEEDYDIKIAFLKEKDDHVFFKISDGQLEFDIKVSKNLKHISQVRKYKNSVRYVPDQFFSLAFEYVGILYFTREGELYTIQERLSSFPILVKKDTLSIKSKANSAIIKEAIKKRANIDENSKGLLRLKPLK